VQGELEQGEFLNYADITSRSLRHVIELREEIAAEIGANVVRWPLYNESRAALGTLMRIASCAAMTNSDRAHGEQMQEQLGFQLDDWLCAEESHVYKPNPQFWHLMASRRSIKSSRRWWHVSAYAELCRTRSAT